MTFTFHATFGGERPVKVTTNRSDGPASSMAAPSFHPWFQYPVRALGKSGQKTSCNSFGVILHRRISGISEDSSISFFFSSSEA